MEWFRKAIREYLENDDRTGAYCYYIGVLESCIEMEWDARAKEAKEITREEGLFSREILDEGKING